MTTVEVCAPAKINLTLHVTGRRDDGYHLLDSLVTFAPVHDRLFLQDGNTLSLTVEGPEASGVPTDMTNLALRAAEVFADGQGASLRLEKYLPAASGIGGGSADAAAALRGMIARREDFDTVDWAMPPDEALRPYAEAILALGADVPMCLLSASCRARGIGEKLEFLKLPPLPAILVNPRVAVSTASVFRGLASRENDPMPDDLPTFENTAECIRWLKTQRNDLEGPATVAAPIIRTVLEALRALPACRLARMSGSGATCFGLFETEGEAKDAGAALQRQHPDWWIAGGTLGSQTALATPNVS